MYPSQGWVWHNPEFGGLLGKTTENQ